MGRQWALVIVVAFVAGSLMTGTMASAEAQELHSHEPTQIFGDPDFDALFGDPDFTLIGSPDFTGIFGDPDFDAIFGDPDFMIQSLQDTDDNLQFQIDSFFDVFFGTESHTGDSFFDIFTNVGPDGTATTPDSFFDVFVELDARDRHFDTEILSMDLRVSNLEDSPPSVATTAAFVKFDGIDGESDESSHDKWSDLLSFNQGQSVPEPSGQSRQRASVTFGDIVVVKALDKSSPKIAEAVLTGKVFPKVEIDLTASYGEAGRLVYYAYELTNARVTSYNIGSSGQGDDVPTDNFSLNFEEIKVTYTERDADGKKKGDVEYTWKVEEGEK